MSNKISIDLLHKEILTDSELEQVIDYYERIVEALRPCPPEYKVFRADAIRHLDVYKSFKFHREKNQ